MKGLDPKTYREHLRAAGYLTTAEVASTLGIGTSEARRRRHGGQLRASCYRSDGKGGGNALKYFASLRLDVRRTGKVEVGNEAVGNRTRARAVKNKCARPFGEAEFDIRWGIGIDRTVDLLEVALKKNVITKSGSHLQLAGKSFAQGMEKARDALLTNPELRGAIELATFDALPGYAQRVRKVA